MLICSKCSSEKIYKNGTRDGVQRYECGNCHTEAKPLGLDDVCDPEVLDQNVKLAKDKQRLLDTNRIERKSFRELARIENSIGGYIQELKTAVLGTKIPSVRPHASMSPKALIVQISDTHFNELVDIVGNKYDFRVASKRLYKYAEKIKLYLQTHRINNVYLVMTGDLLNSDRRVDELLSMATNRAKATFLAVKLLTQFVSDLNQYANVDIISVTGNESRIREDYTFVDALATDNFDFMIYEIMKLIFADSKSVKFLSGNTFEYVFEINNTTILATHGHQLGGMNSPDISKAIAKWSRKGVNIDMIMCGHLHEAKITDTLSRCGSLVGNNAYADVGLNLYGRASQNVSVVHEDGTIDTIRVDLQYVDDNSEMYEVDKDLEAYNAKSISKLQKQTEVFKIVI